MKTRMVAKYTVDVAASVLYIKYIIDLYKLNLSENYHEVIPE